MCVRGRHKDAEKKYVIKRFNFSSCEISGVSHESFRVIIIKTRAPKRYDLTSQKENVYTLIFKCEYLSKWRISTKAELMIDNNKIAKKRHERYNFRLFTDILPIILSKE